jgi:soluble lytic murein transglycosylase-like protein
MLVNRFATLLYTLSAALVLLFTPAQALAVNCIDADAGMIFKKAKVYQKSITNAARLYKVDPNLIRSVIAIESCYNHKAVSHAGAQGLMQLMPDTADRFGVKDSFDSSQNILAGTKYLRFLQQRYKGDLPKVLAAYNAGEGRVDRYNGVPPYKETHAYVKNVTAVYKKLTPAKPKTKPKPKPNTVKKAPQKVWGKPGRQGIAALRARAPHLFKK